MLADLVFLLHLCFVLFVLVGPFIENDQVLLLHAIVVPSLLLHWATNQDICALTLLESHLRGVKMSETFLDRLVGHVYRFPGEAKISSYAIPITLGLWIITLTKLHNRKVIERLFFRKGTDAA